MPLDPCKKSQLALNFYRASFHDCMYGAALRRKIDWNFVPIALVSNPVFIVEEQFWGLCVQILTMERNEANADRFMGEHEKKWPQ